LEFGDFACKSSKHDELFLLHTVDRVANRNNVGVVGAHHRAQKYSTFANVTITIHDTIQAADVTKAGVVDLYRIVKR